MRAHALALAAMLTAGCGPGAEPLADRAATSAAAQQAEDAGTDGTPDIAPQEGPARTIPDRPDEPRLTNLRMLTRLGENAEAYFSSDGRRLIFQGTRPGESECDQMFVMDVDGGNVRRISNGEGRTTCGYFFPTADRVLYSSTHLHDPACPAPPDYSRGYVWALYEFDIWVMDADGGHKRRVTDNGAANFAPYFHPSGEKIIFSSNLDDPDGREFDIYLINVDGTGLERVTTTPEFDGFPMFSPDGSRLVFASNRDHARPGDTNVFIADWVEIE